MRTALALAVLAASCTDSTVERLVVISVTPGTGYNDQATPIVISGEGFYSEAEVTLGESGELSVDDTFEVSLGSTPLTDIDAIDAETIHATVPADMVAGIHSLTVKIPSGDLATLDAAFTVEDPPNAPRLEITTLVLSPDPASSGQEVTLDYLVINTGRVDATNVTVPEPIALGAQASAAGDPTPLVANIAVNGQATFSRTFLASGTGSLTFSAVAEGNDADTSALVTSMPAQSNTIAVQRATFLVLSLDATPTRVSEGQQLALAMAVVNNGEATATGVTPTTPTATASSTGAFTQLAGPAPASVASLLGGASDTFRWTIDTGAGDAGTLALTAGAQGTDFNSTELITATPVSTASVLVQTRPALALTVLGPDSVGVGQTGVLMRVRVANTSAAATGAPATVTDGALRIQPDPTSEFTIVPTQTTTFVPAGESRELTFQVDVASPPIGTDNHTAEGQIVAIDANDNTYALNIDFGTGSAHTFSVGAANQPADLSVALEILSPAGATDGTVSTQQSFTVTAVVENAGSCNVTGGELTLDPSAIGATGSNLTVPLVVGQPVTWDLTASSSAGGPSDLSVSISSLPTDDCDTQPAATTNDTDTVSITTVDRAHLALDATLLPPADDGIIYLREEFQLEVRVTNNGAAVVGTAELQVDPGDLVMSLVSPASLTQPFVADNTAVTFTFNAAPGTTSEDSITVTIVTLPDDENTGADAHVDPSSEALPLRIVDPFVWADGCNGNCGGAARCRDDCVGSCSLPDCDDDCICAMSCENYEGPNGCDIACGPGSTCTMRVNSSAHASIECNNATCSLGCNSVDACQIDCNGTSECVLECNSVDTCLISNCSTLPTDCGDDDWACNADCP